MKSRGRACGCMSGSSSVLGVCLCCMYVQEETVTDDVAQRSDLVTAQL